MSFPYSVGQIPVYYSHFNTGRPATIDSNRNYNSSYNDLSVFPRYEFGYGLSYTHFQYSNLQLSKKKLKAHEELTAAVVVTNTGKYEGEEIVQLYIR